MIVFEKAPLTQEITPSFEEATHPNQVSIRNIKKLAIVADFVEAAHQYRRFKRRLIWEEFGVTFLGRMKGFFEDCLYLCEPSFYMVTKEATHFIEANER
jgi:hypothetical protein